MYSCVSRANAVLGTAAWTLALMATALALSSHLINYRNPPHPTVSLDVGVLRLHQRTFNETIKHDAAALRIDMDADLSPLWNWNVKHIFIYLVARYSTTAFPDNEVMVWDRIVNNREQTFLSVHTRAKYCLEDNGNHTLLGDQCHV